MMDPPVISNCCSEVVTIGSETVAIQPYRRKKRKLLLGGSASGLQVEEKCSASSSKSLSAGGPSKRPFLSQVSVDAEIQNGDDQGSMSGRRCTCSADPNQESPNGIRIDESLGRPLFRTFTGHAGVISCVRWRPKGCSMCDADTFISTSWDGKCLLWKRPQAGSGETGTSGKTSIKCDISRHDKKWDMFSILSRSRGLRCADWLADGRRVVTGGFDKWAYVIDAECRVVVGQFPHKDSISALVAATQSDHLFLSAARNSVYLWDMRSSKRFGPMKKMNDKVGYEIQSMDYLSPTEVVVSTDYQAADLAKRSVYVWDQVSTSIVKNYVYKDCHLPVCVRKRPRFTDGGNTSHDIQFFVSTNGDYITGFAGSEPYKPVAGFGELRGHRSDGFKSGFTFSPSGNFLITGSADSGLDLYDLGNKQNPGAHTKYCFREPIGQNITQVDAQLNSGGRMCLVASSWQGKLFVVNDLARLMGLSKSG